ncbi:hypothetical protein [Vreelandella arctica]|uniref:hypothetical protein n=1 Tax=Vreelandella arctica TaxID=3126499 RepID=UPI00300E51EF
MNSGNLYSINDKAIYDALHQSKLTKSDLKELFLARGIVISSDASREDLARYFSRLLHDYYDYQALAKRLGSSSRRDKSTISYVDMGELTIDEVEDAAHELSDLIKEYDATAQVNRIGDKVEVLVNYRITNFNKNEFSQVINREGVIDLEIEDGKLLIRSPLTDTVENVKEILVESVAVNNDVELSIESINMKGISSAEKRTEFFEHLVHQLDGLAHHDVTDVYIYNPKNKSDDFEDSDGDIEEEVLDLGVHITRASLKGEKVLLSEEIKGLYDKGFYIWKIVWQAVENSFDSDIYEFEAQFKNAEEFTGFSYLARGFYKYKEGGEYNSSRNGFSDIMERKLGVKIEKAAQLAVQHIANTDSEQLGDDDDQGESS